MMFTRTLVLLLGGLLSTSCLGKPKSALNDLEIIEALEDNDRGLGEPAPGEWLAEHREPGQSLARYQALTPTAATTQHHTIYLQPIGDFTTAETEVIHATAAYLAIFFGLPTRVLPALSDAGIPASARRTGRDGSEQLLVPFLLDSVLHDRVAAHAVATLAITAKDLYPAPSWGFVFGQARPTERVGVSSMYRYYPKPLDAGHVPSCLHRLLKTSAHEIGHMFTLQHCTHAVCVMNGTNSLREFDSRPNRLCSECLSKLHWNLQFDIRRRLQELGRFFQRHSITQDYDVVQADLQEIE